MEIKKLEAAIEAILFTMGESVELSQIADAIQQDKTFIVFFFAEKLIRLFQFNDLDTTIFFLVFVHHILNDLTSGFFILLNSIPKSRHLQMLCWKRFPSLHINSR